jgi:hypothetical protein
MTSARDFLVRGLLAGLIAGLVAFGVAYVVGEPSVNVAIAFEELADLAIIMRLSRPLMMAQLPRRCGDHCSRPPVC